MRVKKYTVDSMPEAMRLIKQELGSDAVILDQKKIKVGGFLGFFAKEKIEVTAAVDKRTSSQPKQESYSINLKVDETSKPTQVSDYRDMTASPSNYGQAAINYKGNAIRSEYAQDQKINQQNMQLRKEQISQENTEVQEELTSIKNMFMKFVMSSSNQDVPSNFKKIYQHLLDQELDEEFANNLMTRVLEKTGTPHNTNEHHLLELIEHEIAKIVEEHLFIPSRKSSKQIYAFVGPTGVGKTTTIAKLAAYFVLERKMSVGFITADTYRISAVDQLKTYANILNIPVEVVINHDDMRQAIKRLEGVDVILIDTAGRNYKNEIYINELNSMLTIANPDEIFLVHSLTTKQKDLNEITHNFSKIPINSFIFTKTDETYSYGPLLNMINRYNKSIFLLTNGQNVPEDIVFIDSKKIAKMIVGDSYE